MKHLSLLGLLLLLSLSSCIEDDFRDMGQLVEENQILGIRAEPPKAQGGSSITFDALTHWPKGEVHYLWIFCMPEYDSGVLDTVDTCVSNHLAEGDPLLPCGDPSFPNPCSLGQGETATLDVPNITLPPSLTEAFFYLELVASSAANVATACNSTITGRAPSQECLVGLKTVPYITADSTDTNMNPRLDPLLLNGATLDGTAVHPLSLNSEEEMAIVGVRVDPSSIDEIDGATPDNPRTIYLDLHLYTDCGTLAFHGDPELFESDGGYHREMECTNPGDTTAPTCETIEVEWRPEHSGECKFIVQVWDIFGGNSWATTYFIVQGLPQKT